MSFQASQVRSLARALHPCSSRMRQLAMLIAYLDESVDGKGTEVFAMAGLLGDSTQWEVFEAKWKAVLRKFKIKEFKASACEYQQREFRDWTEDKCVSLQNDLIAVIDEVQPTGITTAINLADCKSLLDRRRKDPYHLCFQYLLVEIARKAVNCPEEEEVAFILDERTKVMGPADTLRLSVKTWSHFESRNRIGTVAPHSSEIIVPLQAADWFAYETHKAMFNQLGGDGPRNKRKTLKLPIERYVVTSIYFYQDNLQQLLKELNDLEGITP